MGAPYDPEAWGARCEECVLRKMREGPPVPPEWRESARALLVGEAPGKDEVREGRPFVGAAGRELDAALRAVGIRREWLTITNSIACRPPGNDLGLILHKLQKLNKARKAAGQDPIPTPIECCAPRLRRELARFPRVIASGGIALRAVTGHAGSIMEVRGGPREVELPAIEAADGTPAAPALALRLLPTLHSAFVMRAKRWRGAFRADLSRAWRWFTSGLAWRDPECVFVPSPAQLREWLDREVSAPFTTCDIETLPGFPKEEHFDSLYDRLRCIGIGSWDGRRAIVVPFRSVETRPSYYTSAEQAQIVAILRDYFDSFRIVGHNFGYYDAQVIRAQLDVNPRRVVDTIGLHKFAEPELPHGLAYLGSVHTDIFNWKAGKTATQARTDHELWAYCSRDNAVTALCVPALQRQIVERSQVEPARVFPKLQAICVGLHRNGMHVDQEVRRRWDWKLRVDAAKHAKTVREGVGQADFNPGSFPQVGDLLFNRWDLTPHHYTDKGEPSTDDDALRAILTSYGLDDRRKAIVQAIRLYRRTTKLRGTFVIRLRPIGAPVDEVGLVDYGGLDEDEREEIEERAKKGEPACGLCLPDGRVHPDYNAQGTKGWRFSGSNPNPQNFPSKLRDMISAAPGHCLVGCDQAQLELRLVAALAKCAYYLEAFAKGTDPHKVLCVDFFADAFSGASKDIQTIYRRLTKEFTYSCAARGTRVVTTGKEGSRAIEDLHPGEDMTWSWDGERCAPALITNKWSRGTRECVRVTFTWPGHRESETFTTDHRFLLRDGTYKEAAQLQPGDGLMPFGRWRSGPYRMIDLFNDGGREQEHRAICGLVPGDGMHAHHKNEDGRDNSRGNLVVKTAAGHLSDHWDDARRARQRVVNAALWAGDIGERLRAGRITSEAWREANVVNYRKMRAGLAKARENGGGTNKGQSWTRLAAFHDKIGVLTDPHVAAPPPLTRQAVYYYRRQRGIPPPLGQRRHNHTVVSVEPVGLREVWDIEVDHPAHNFALASGIFVHNSLYAAEDKTKHEILTAAEDDNEALLFPWLTIRETAAFSRKWMDRCPEIPAWWESLIREYRRAGHLLDPIGGLRCDFLDGEDLNALANYQPQTSGAYLTHLATFRALEEIPFEKWGPGTGLIQQGHDSLVFEVPMTHGPWKVERDDKGREKVTWCESNACKCPANTTARILEEAFRFDGNRWGLPVPFVGETKIGMNWKVA